MTLAPDDGVNRLRRAGQIMVASIQYNPNRCWADREFVWSDKPEQCRNIDIDHNDGLGLCKACREDLLP